MSLYEEQQARAERWLNRCTLLFTVISVYIGILVLGKSKSIKVALLLQEDIISSYIPLLGLVLLMCGYLCAVFVMWLRPYETIVDPTDLIKNKYPNGLPNEEKFFDDIILDLSLATKANKKQNDKRAKWFQIAVVAVFSGIATHGIAILTIVTK